VVRSSVLRSLAVRLGSYWVGRSLFEQFAIAALLALGCGVLLLDGWVSIKALQVPLALVGTGAGALLFALVGDASETIAAQQRAARSWDAERVRLIAEKDAEVRRCIDESHRRSAEINDRVMRRVGVDLHDGPAQLISLALLRLDTLHPERAGQNCSAAVDDFERIQGALKDALAEIRGISSGLTLPELGCVSPEDALRLAVRNHERRTATTVACDVEGLPRDVAPPVKSCLYRFAQEALNNAYRHAGGRGQMVRANCSGNTIEVEVVDSGPGFEPDNKVLGSHLGLVGMRERVASLGGTLEIVSRPGAGTRLTTRFKMADCASGQG